MGPLAQALEAVGAPCRELRYDAEVGQQRRVGAGGAPVEAGGLVEGRVVDDPGRVERVGREEGAEAHGVWASARSSALVEQELLHIALQPAPPDAALEFDGRLGESAPQGDLRVVAQVGSVRRQRGRLRREQCVDERAARAASAAHGP